MFVGNYNKIAEYGYLSQPLVNKIKQALTLILSGPVVGNHVIEENDFWFEMLELSTRPANSKNFEIHKQFIDVHVLIKGQEIMGFANNELTVTDLSMSAEDVYFGTTQNGQYIELNEGGVAIFYPGEIHKPLCHIEGDAQQVRKAVIKIRQSFLISSVEQM
ncbi:MAG: biofilm protein TabA [Psychromonas sp.]|jgi:biofilm protein TabA